jgi:tripartite-type tricarboxylate transporter receptor subunit TctC
MSGLRKLFPIALLAIIAGCGSAPAAADETYPSRLVKVILPFPPGSTLDALARVQMAQKWGQAVVIENITGGGGNIGTDRFARAAPDGYTLLFSPPGPLTINPLIYSDVTFDPAKFVPMPSSPPSCSRRARISPWCTCPTGARRRRSTTSSPATST